MNILSSMYVLKWNKDNRFILIYVTCVAMIRSWAGFGYLNQDILSAISQIIGSQMEIFSVSRALSDLRGWNNVLLDIRHSFVWVSELHVLPFVSDSEPSWKQYSIPNSLSVTKKLPHLSERSPGLGQSRSVVRENGNRFSIEMKRTVRARRSTSTQS